MSVEIVMVRKGSTLIVASAQDREELERFSQGKALGVSVSQKPPEDLVRLYRSLCSKIAKATGHFPDGDAVHTALMLRAHKVEAVYVAADGSIAKGTPVSTKQWSLPEWRAYMDFIWPIILDEILPGIPSGYLRREIEEMTGVRFKTAEAAA